MKLDLKFTVNSKFNRGLVLITKSILALLFPILHFGLTDVITCVASNQKIFFFYLHKFKITKNSIFQTKTKKFLSRRSRAYVTNRAEGNQHLNQ